MTFLGALRCDRLTAPCVFDGPINGKCFRAYVNQQLVPTLEPDDIVILDNLGSHKSKAIRDAIRAAGARLWFLPKYSPYQYICKLWTEQPQRFRLDPIHHMPGLNT